VLAIAEIKEIVPPRMRYAHGGHDPDGHGMSSGSFAGSEVT
jgi:hypothetical protein